MATADLPKSKKRAAAATEDKPAKRRSGKSRAFRYGCYATLLLLLLGCYFAPAIVANTPLKQWVLASVLQLDGSAELQSASLGWFSPVELHDFEIRDAQGDTVVKLPAAHTEKTLIGLLLDISDLGQIVIEQPHVHLVFHERDSNLEQMFAELIAAESESHMRVEFKVTGGTILIDDLFAKRQFRIDNLEADGAVGGDQPLTLVTSGQLADAKQPGSFNVELRTKGSAENPTSLASGKIECQSSALPLELAEPLARRRLDKAELSGRLSTRLSGAWGEMAGDGQTSVQGQSLITNLSLAAAALGNDRIELERVDMPCHIVQNGDLVDIEQLGIDCELGKINLAGSFKQSDLSATDVFAALTRENYELKGHIDLTQLARLLPDTLTIREGTEITAGRIDLLIASRQQPEGMTWTGDVNIGQLGARADGRALTWNNPLAIQFSTHESKDGIVVDKAQCTSSFLQLDGSGTLSDATATATFDLSRLVTELKQFSDLNGVQLAGSGTAQLACKRSETNQFTAEVDCQAKGFQFIGPQGRTWREDTVAAKLNIDGQMKDGALSRIERAELSVEAAGERLQARLEQPLDNPSAATWPLQCSWRGPLAAWSARLDTCLGMPGWDLSGAGALQAALRCSAETIEIAQLKGDVAQLRAWGHGFFITEPTASVAAEGRYALKQNRLEITTATLKSGPTTADVRQATVQSDNDGWAVAGGTTVLHADLAQWHRWQHDPRAAATWQVGGKLRAEAELKHAAGVTSGQIDGSIEQLQVVELVPPAAGHAPASWQEAKVTLVARGSYRSDSQQLELQNLQVASSALACATQGRIGLVEQGGEVDLKGTLEYDWQQLAPLWRQYLGAGVQISGRQSRSVALSGRLTGPATSADSWRAVVGEAAIGWTEMNVYGLQVGPGEVTGKLAEGLIRTNPIDIAISEGRFTLTPVMRVSPAPAELFLSRGPLLSNVHLSPEICARGLKFIAPVLAETTVATGTFSVSLDGGRVPMADFTAGDLSGKMAIRGQVNAGPVAREFLVLVNELTNLLRKGSLIPGTQDPGALVSVDSSEVEFRMVDRRIYHRGLKFNAGAVPITTHGSVGFDESIALVAEVPIQATFLGRDLSLGALEGRTVQIPIGGTLAHPKLDRGGMQQLIGKSIENATRGALIDQVNRQFERLLPVQK